MHNWKASVQFNGEEETMYSTVYFKISNKLYQKMTSATKRHKAFTDCDFYDELNKKAEKAAEKYLDDISDHIEKPARKDYDSYDDYLYAMEEYRELVDEAEDEYCIESIKIEDPVLPLLFRDFIVGKRFPEWAGIEQKELEFNCVYEVDERYKVVLSLDGNGTVTGVVSVNGSGLESESLRSSSFGDCAPDFEFIEEELDIEWRSQNGFPLFSEDIDI